MKKLFIILTCFLFLIIPAFAQEEKSTFYLYGQFNSIAAAERDYIHGESDFSEMGSYSTSGFGTGYQYNISKTFFAGVDLFYSMGGKVKLTDPSDGDTVNVDGYPQFCGFVAGGVNVGTKNIVLFLNAGAGISSISGSEKKYKSSLDYDVTLESPEKKTAFAGFGGTGLRVLIGSFGLFANARYTLDHFKKLSIVSGLCFMF